MREPYFRKIVEGLQGPLDPDVFEECANALLQEVYPGLVSIRGGHDDGMDGAIADGEGEPLPLIVTTQRDVGRNLRKSLDRHLATGGSRRSAVLATSRALSAPRRRKLRDLADERGVTLLQIHDQHDFAARLYRNSAWTKELLGIEGKPSALSTVPRTRGFVRQDVELIGREADLAWLEETSGDRLIIGQPGAGKTYLLLQLVRRGEALFLANDDEGRIADDLRDLRPQAVIVDDAHLEAEKLARLCQIREEIGWQGEFLATGWPGTEDELISALGIPPGEGVRSLELLTRKQILEVLREIGVRETDDDPYLVQLVEQAANKPGLAVTLGSLWLRGEWRDVLTGRAIRRSLIPALHRVLGSDPTEILACFALGGDRGMTMDGVGDYLDIGRHELHQRVKQASHGGILRITRDRHLAVEPEALRSALLKEVFFDTPLLSYKELLTRAPDPEQAVETVVRAAYRGAPVPKAELRTLVAEQGSLASWAVLARLDEEEGTWVLEHYPGPLVKVAPATLETAPRETVRRLISEARSIPGVLHSDKSEPLRVLQAWLLEIPFVFGRSDRFRLEESLSRRRMVVGIVTDRRRSQAEPREGRATAVRAALLALSSHLRSVRSEATRSSIRLHDATLPTSAIPDVLSLWREIFPQVSAVVEEVWRDLSNLIYHWIHPYPAVGDERRSVMRSVAVQMLRDLASLQTPSPGLRSAVVELAARLDLELDVDLDEEYELLFPRAPKPAGGVEDYRRARSRQRDEARTLAREWAQRRPEEGAERLKYLEGQANTYRNSFSEARLAFCRALAGEVEAPMEWLQHLLEAGVEPLAVQFLLERLVRERPPGWRALVEECLDSTTYSDSAADLVLRASETLPEDLSVQAVLPGISPHLVETACLQGAVPLSTLKVLLGHRSEEVAMAAAIGEWLLDPEQTVRPEVAEEWQEAILRAGAESQIDDQPRGSTSHWLKAILGSDRELASSWLEARLEDEKEYEFVYEDGAYRAAVQTLSTEQRKHFLETLTPGRLSDQLIPWLVDQSPDLFGVLLKRDALARCHLDPLGGGGPPGSDWASMAELALDAGYKPEEIAGAAFAPPYSIAGFGVEHWSRWRSAFESLRNETEGRLREVAALGLELAEERLSADQKQKRRFEETGRF